MWNPESRRKGCSRIRMVLLQASAWHTLRTKHSSLGMMEQVSPPVAFVLVGRYHRRFNSGSAALSLKMFSASHPECLPPFSISPSFVIFFVLLSLFLLHKRITTNWRLIFWLSSLWEWLCESFPRLDPTLTNLSNKITWHIPSHVFLFTSRMRQGFLWQWLHLAVQMPPWAIDRSLRQSHWKLHV